MKGLYSVTYRAGGIRRRGAPGICSCSGALQVLLMEDESSGVPPCPGKQQAGDISLAGSSPRMPSTSGLRWGRTETRQPSSKRQGICPDQRSSTLRLRHAHQTPARVPCSRRSQAPRTRAFLVQQRVEPERVSPLAAQRATPGKSSSSLSRA